jgi:hypothetical protein
MTPGYLYWSSSLPTGLIMWYPNLVFQRHQRRWQAFVRQSLQGGAKAVAPFGEVFRT